MYVRIHSLVKSIQMPRQIIPPLLKTFGVEPTIVFLVSFTFFSFNDIARCSMIGTRLDLPGCAGLFAMKAGDVFFVLKQEDIHVLVRSARGFRLLPPHDVLTPRAEEESTLGSPEFRVPVAEITTSQHGT